MLIKKTTRLSNCFMAVWDEDNKPTHSHWLFQDRWCTDKKERKNFLRYKKIQKGAFAKSYIRKGFLMYEERRKYLVIFAEAFTHIWLCNCSLLNFLTYEETFLLFFISVECSKSRPIIGLRRGFMVFENNKLQRRKKTNQLILFIFCCCCCLFRCFCCICCHCCYL